MGNLGTNLTRKVFWDRLGGHARHLKWRQRGKFSSQNTEEKWQSMLIGVFLDVRIITEPSLGFRITEFQRTKNYGDSTRF